MITSKKIPLFLLISISLFWIVTAIKPLNRSDWFLENILFIITFIVLIGTYKKFQFSNLSYILITLFSAIHLIGAHYTYSEVPLGFTISEFFNETRNHFDRIAHFLFGLFLTYPFHEILMRQNNIRGVVSFVLPFLIVSSFSAIFEVIEWLLVIKLPPELGEAYLGMQNDRWDAQKDILLAVIGSALALIGISVFRKNTSLAK